MSSRTNGYDRAIAFVAFAPFVSLESIDLIAHLFERDEKAVVEDIYAARSGKYVYSGARKVIA